MWLLFFLKGGKDAKYVLHKCKCSIKDWFKNWDVKNEIWTKKFNIINCLNFFEGLFEPKLCKNSNIFFSNFRLLHLISLKIIDSKRDL